MALLPRGNASAAVRLFATVVVLSLVPVGTAAWMLERRAARDERAAADARVRDAATAVAARLAAAVGEAERRAATVAGRPALQDAAVRGDRRGVARALREPGLYVRMGGAWLPARPPADAPLGRVSLEARGRTVAVVAAAVPLGDETVRRLASDATPVPGDRVLVLAGDDPVGSSAPVQALRLADGRAELDGAAYRMARAPVDGTSRFSVVAVTSEAAVQERVDAFRRRLLLAAAISGLALAYVLYRLGRPLVRALSHARREAETDPLTGVANRRHFEERLPRVLERAALAREPVSLVLLDVDDFKRTNDTHGHAAGDEVLRRVGATLLATARAGDVAARIGGEEFAVVLPGSGLEGAHRFAERLRAALEAVEVARPEWPGLRLTASIGIASAPPARDGGALYAAADAALYVAKRNGKNRVEPSLGAGGAAVPVPA